MCLLRLFCGQLDAVCCAEHKRLQERREPDVQMTQRRAVCECRRQGVHHFYEVAHGYEGEVRRYEVEHNR